MLETGDVPILFSLSADAEYGYYTGTGTRRSQDYMASFWLVTLLQSNIPQ